MAAEELTAGSVMVLVDAEGNETVIKKSALGEDSVRALVDGSCTVKVVDNTKTFADVADGVWYTDAVAFASSHELFKGTSATAFSPAGLMTRSMLVTVLHRLEDTPTAETVNSFGDVADDTWYTDAVDWSNENKIVLGTGSGFNPDGNVSREQIATILYRYMQYLGLDVSASAELDRFEDGSATSAWASDAMKWAVGAGIIAGESSTRLNPNGDATRAEVATMLQRLINLMV